MHPASLLLVLPQYEGFDKRFEHAGGVTRRGSSAFLRKNHRGSIGALENRILVLPSKLVSVPAKCERGARGGRSTRASRRS